MKLEVKMMDFGLWMKEKRKELKLTQEQLSYVVMSNKNTISRYESGDRFPPLDVAERIVTFFGADLVIKENNDV